MLEHWVLSELGPFIIMEYIENDCDLVGALDTPGLKIRTSPS